MAAGNRQMRFNLRATISFLLGGTLLFLSSCTTIGSIVEKMPTRTTKGARTDGLAFKSEDYVVYILQGGENSETLAERFLGDRKKSWMIEDANEGVFFKKDQAVVIPLKTDNKGGLTAQGYQVVPVLNYHHFLEDCGSLLCVPPAVFEQQMKYLRDNGYRAITLEDLSGFLQYREALPRKSVMITIDDGYRSAYDVAYPILKRYGFIATLFIYTDYIGISDKAITWDQLKEMKADGFQIGSHTLSHIDLTMKEQGDSERDFLARMKKELVDSKQIIDLKLKQNTMAVAFPFGRYDESILAISEQAGYELGFSVERGGNPFFADPLSLKREQILKKDLESFVAGLSTFYEFSLE